MGAVEVGSMCKAPHVLTRIDGETSPKDDVGLRQPPEPCCFNTQIHVDRGERLVIREGRSSGVGDEVRTSETLSMGHRGDIGNSYAIERRTSAGMQRHGMCVIYEEDELALTPGASPLPSVRAQVSSARAPAR
mmetsp:Transcript_110584/g.174215  ORF Transcript_110584/g.174215 Transcript_110584/m.174215 type:complete len:133 (-) Transcript_110584:73-471(-)